MTVRISERSCVSATFGMCSTKVNAINHTCRSSADFLCVDPALPTLFKLALAGSLFVNDR